MDERIELTMDEMWQLVRKLHADVVTAYQVQGEMRALLEEYVACCEEGSPGDVYKAVRAWLAAHPAQGATGKEQEG